MDDLKPLRAPARDGSMTGQATIFCWHLSLVEHPNFGKVTGNESQPIFSIQLLIHYVSEYGQLKAADPSGWTASLGWASEGCYGEDRPHPDRPGYALREFAMHIIWTIIIGFIAGVIAKFITPGKNEPSGFILTTILGIVGAFLATYLGQAIGWYRADQGAGLIGAVVGAVIVLLIWGFIAGRRSPSP